ncbi:MAG: bifunctional 4-hydroxy-3-methylbut-2-enyl diphosphate reductase/30S ribosomal protein S1 [Eubacteriales bacterium]|nr:bifunctional 4-hydroxy-3-methylbut-2-enyl diphosphate reductase/30S ribosomal protein S1 [Eubacteriales bacterium]
MPLHVASHAGFCMGVSNAVACAQEAAREAKTLGIPCYSLGEVIHNPSVVASLREQGLTAVDTPGEASGGLLVIRSHGVSPRVLEAAREAAKKTVDCTCAFVHHVQQLVHQSSRDGRPVIILGDAAHPEVVGIIGWCQAERFVVEDEAQADQLPDSCAEALVVSQTTFPPFRWDALTRHLLSRFPDLRLKKTICQATALRQAEAEELSKRADKMIVVGGRKSANTRKLAETCRKWCPDTFLVENASELSLYPLTPARELIGITAGASTPAWSLKEVVDKMYDMELNEKKDPETPIQETDTQADPIPQDSEAIRAEEPAQAEAPAAEAHAPEAEEAEPAEEAEAEATAETGEAEPETQPEAPEAEAEVEAGEEEPAAPPITKEQSMMEMAADSFSRIRARQVITGKVVQLTENEVSVNIGYKSDGLLSRSELVDKDVQLGDEIEVEIVKVNDGEGNVILSQRNIVNRKVWEEIKGKYESGELVDGVGKEAVKGGLLADIQGVRAFIPASHLAQRYVDKISQFIGQDMKLKIIEIDDSKKRVVASRKEALAIENAAIREAVWSNLHEGQVVKGVVRRFTNFGAFVDLGGVDGLIHVSDLSWSRNIVPSAVLKANQEVEVKILSLDRERDRIALGYKQLQPRPWDNVEEKYPVGSILERKVVRVRDFGAFVELEPGVDGLVHISQVAPTRIERVEDVLTPGQDVRVKVLSVDPVAKRISLSIREAMEDTVLDYSADIPGEAEVDYGGAYERPVEGAREVASAAPAERQETTLELAMRKAREELMAKEEQEAPQEEDDSADAAEEAEETAQETASEPAEEVAEESAEEPGEDPTEEA